MLKKHKPLKTLSFNNRITHLRFLNFVLAFAIFGTVMLLFTSAAPIAGFYGSIEQDQVNRINAQRSSIGRPSLRHIECLNSIAEQHTTEMANRGSIYHTPSSDLVNRVQYACGGSWSIIGENVGVGYDSGSLFNAFMASSAHRNNIESGNFSRIGVGAYFSADGRLWVTQIFANCSNCTNPWNTNATLPTDPVKPVPKARRLFVNASGQGYVLDSFGKTWPLGGAPLTGKTHWDGWHIARALAVKPDGTEAILMDGWGGVHPVGSSPNLATTGYWSGWDIARDLLVTDWTTRSGLKLDGWGGLHKFGSNPPATTGAAYWQGKDLARRLAKAPNGGYTLSAWGSVHAFGGAKRVSSGPYWSGWDIARDVEISPDGTSGYVLDGWGGIHALTIEGSPASPKPFGGPYWAGQDVAVDMVIIDWATPKGYVLDYRGGVHSFGGATSIGGGPYW